MLMAVPKLGRVKAARLLNQLSHQSQSKTVGGLSERLARRARLADLTADGPDSAERLFFFFF